MIIHVAGKRYLKNDGVHAGAEIYILCASPYTGTAAMENEGLITAMFVGARLLSYVVIPGLLVIWDRVLDDLGGS